MIVHILLYIQRLYHSLYRFLKNYLGSKVTNMPETCWEIVATGASARSKIGEFQEVYMVHWKSQVCGHFDTQFSVCFCNFYSLLNKSL